MKPNKMQFALIVATALVGLSRANAETMNITSQFTVLEDMSAADRAVVQQKIQTQNPSQQFDWNNVLIGTNEDGKIEVRERSTLKLQAVAQPTCVGAY
jgi:hypothetical protein